MNISQNGINLLKEFEGCKLSAYYDGLGRVWTIGYGHTRGVKEGEKITQSEANNLLDQDVKWAVTSVNNLVKVAINQNQFDALTSFEFNTGGLAKSDLLVYLNRKQMHLASAEFPKWDHANGKVVQGLLNRRLAEQKLFNTPVPKAATRDYKVVKGDNLTLIANRFGVTVAKLCQLNPSIKNPNLIQIGQVIQVPNKYRRLAEQKLFNTPVPKAATRDYKVVKGDNLTLIANRFGVTVAKLCQLNPSIKNPNLIQIGQVIQVPNK